MVTIPPQGDAPVSRPRGVSIVVPVEGREGLVRDLLKSIRECNSPKATQLEIIIVDSSKGEAAHAIAESCCTYNARCLQGDRSVRKKRNVGASEASFDHILFLDSDCTASKDLLVTYEEFIMAQRNHGPCFAGAGPTVFRGEETWFTERLKHSSLLGPFQIMDNGATRLWATTSNLLVSREAFDAARGFPENLPFRLGGDDTDFGLRLAEKDIPLWNVPAARVHHSWKTWQRPLAVMRRSFRWGVMQNYLLAAHPRFRRPAAPDFAVYLTLVIIVAFALLYPAGTGALLLPLVFAASSLAGHALLAGIRNGAFVEGFVTDLVLASVECPFGLGKVWGAIFNHSLRGVFFRLGRDDRDMNFQFPEIVADLWFNNLGLLAALFAYACVVANE